MKLQETETQFGDVTPGEEYKHSFPLPENISKVDVMNSSCPCLSGKYNKKTNTLDVTYVPGKIPPHLREIGVPYLKVVKEIGIKFTGEDEVLRTFFIKINATIIK